MKNARDTYAALTIELAPRVRALPIVHGSLEFTAAVRRLFLSAPPALCALELPVVFASSLQRALRYADQVPVLTAPENEQRAALHFVLEPLEPLVEAARSSLEANIPFHCIDGLEAGPGLVWEAEDFPDTFCLTAMSVSTLYAAYRNSTGPAPTPAGDRRREIFMARELRNLTHVVSGSLLSEERPLLVVCGIRHVESLARLLSLSESSFRRYTEQESANVDGGEESEDDDAEPLEALLERHERREEHADDDPIEITTLSRETAEVLVQPGYYNTAWLYARRGLAAVDRFQRVFLQRQVYRDTVERYERESGELVPPQREKLFFQFTRNWSWLRGKLLPDTYRLVMAARAFGNDNFARIFFDLLAFLPPLNAPPFPERKLSLDDLYRDKRLIRFRLQLNRPRRKTPGSISRRFQREKYPGEWAEQWQGGGICSYPPEDLIIENFGRDLQKSATAILRGSGERTVPFTSSMLDGIDYRETIRNYHLGRIYVKDLQIRGIDAGSVVIIFSENHDEHAWRVVWWGEHAGESDMAFYATNPAERLRGPGICQSRYGGLMMTYPPGRLHDIWNDEDYADFPGPGDRLVAAAIEYNEKRAVVHLAHRPPSPRMYNLAARYGQKIVHIPLSTISPVMLARVRRFHVLDSRDRRNDADDYIW